CSSTLSCSLCCILCLVTCIFSSLCCLSCLCCILSSLCCCICSGCSCSTWQCYCFTREDQVVSANFTAVSLFKFSDCYASIFSDALVCVACFNLDMVTVEL